MAATLREHGVPADVVGRDEAADVVVPAARRDEALALMAARMDEIRDRVRDGEPEPARTGQPDGHDGDADDVPAPGSRPLVTERLRQLWPVPVLLVPLLVLLGMGSLPANFAVMVVLAGMAVVLAMRQRRRR